MSTNPGRSALLLGAVNCPCDLPQVQLAILTLEQLGFNVALGLSSNMAANQFDLIWISGGVEIRSYLVDDTAHDTKIDSSIMDMTQSFYHARKVIVAPCMALPIAIESLSAVAGAGELCRTRIHGMLVEYPDLRLYTTNRPLLGKSREQISSAFNQIMNAVSGRINTSIERV